ncbi:MAG: hypothetical protein HKN51_00750 [Saprospiraceae bacterium]|nr:hypothetical protein [Saprospiraceae bacterium]
MNCKSKNLLVSLLLITLGFSCQKDVEHSSNEGPTIIPMDSIVTPNEEANYLNFSSDYIFDQDKLPTFDLILSQENLDYLDDNPAREEYVEGSLMFENEMISQVGIRYKGSIGAFVNCVSGNNWTNPSGHKKCTKLSMKVKINYQDKARKFYGLKKLQFHAMNLDPTQMRDRLGYWLFRKAGVPAPRSIHCRLNINGTYYGVFALVEQIDGRFSKYHFDEGDGNVYKEVWPIRSNGNANSNNIFISALETNEETADVSLMTEFAEDIFETSTDSLIALVERWMIPEEIISYAVIDRLIKNDDGAFHWYCSGNSCNNHNYYWYEDAVNKRMHLIPWDLDNAFENISGQNPVTRIADDWGATRNSCNTFAFGGFSFPQRSAACDKLTKAWVQFDNLYDTKKQEFITSIFSAETIDRKLNEWSQQIYDATEEAYELYDDAISISKWEAEISRLKNDLEIMRNQ